MIAPRFALGAPGPPETIFNAVDITISMQCVFPGKEVGLGSKLLASANLGTGEVVRQASGSSVGVGVGMAVGFMTARKSRRGARSERLDDLVFLLYLATKGYNVISRMLLGDGGLLVVSHWDLIFRELYLDVAMVASLENSKALLLVAMVALYAWIFELNESL
eukprot:8064489-Ditylum_brightwellii.AAC.2